MEARFRALASVACLVTLASVSTPGLPSAKAETLTTGATSSPFPFQGLRPLWSSVRGVMDAPSAHARTAVRNGMLLAWAYEPPATALVALDLHTGRERWRMPMPTEGRPEIALAGDLALVRRSIGVTAVDLGTGRQRWTRRLCWFQSDLETIADLRVGIGTCAVPDPPGKHEWHPRMIMAVAVDLASGDELWRRETVSAREAILAAAPIFTWPRPTPPTPTRSRTRVSRCSRCTRARERCCASSR